MDPSFWIPYESDALRLKMCSAANVQGWKMQSSRRLALGGNQSPSEEGVVENRLAEREFAGLLANASSLEGGVVQHSANLRLIASEIQMQ